MLDARIDLQAPQRMVSPHIAHSRAPKNFEQARRFLEAHPCRRPNGTAALTKAVFEPRPVPMLRPPREPVRVAPDAVFRESYAEVIKGLEEQWRTQKVHMLKNPMYAPLVKGVMNPRRTVTTVKPVIMLDEDSDEEYDETDTSSFFRLSQITGFSKNTLCEIFKKWITVTRKDMIMQQFAQWMRSIGFQDRLIINRLFEIFDEDGGGSISFPECAIGLSYIKERDIKLPKFEIDQNDAHFYKVCFKLLDLTDDGEVTRFELFKVFSSALQTNSKDTNKLVDILLEKVLLPDDVTKIVNFPKFKRALEQHRFLWRFFPDTVTASGLAARIKGLCKGAPEVIEHHTAAA